MLTAADGGFRGSPPRFASARENPGWYRERVTRPLFEDALAHHVWATLQVIDSCLPLTPEQLETAVPGTYGPILETVRHLVGSDRSYLFAMTGERVALIDEDHMDLAELRAVMDENGPTWSQLLAGDLDPDAMTYRRRPDGSETHAPVGIRLAQALDHGTDHRSHICTILTTLGVEPPHIDAWAYADVDGRVTEIPPTS